MTDVTVFDPAASVRRLDLSSAAAKARVRSRYRAEARFRSYGVIALGITAVFLTILIADILMKGLPAFTQHSLTIDVPVTADLADPEGKGTADSVQRGDYNAMVRNAVRASLPGVEGRVASNRLSKLLSSGSGDELRAAVIADPKLVGKTVTTTAVLSDDADLYFKGVGTEIEREAGTVAITPSDVKGQITLTGAGAFTQEAAAAHKVLDDRLAVMNAQADLWIAANDEGLRQKGAALRAEAQALTPKADDPAAQVSFDTTMSSRLVALNGGVVKLTAVNADSAVGDVLIPLTSTASAAADSWQRITYVTPEGGRKIADMEVAFLDRLQSEGKVHRHFNTLFFTSGDSREPELAGIRGSLVGSILTLAVTLALCLPIGVMAAVYLEEFARKNWFTDLIEININNLAAVPSIVFGLLGLAVFLNFFGLPRSAPVVGGLVLALLVLPTIIIASRAALRAVPPSIKEAALGVGASHQQAVFHHVLPLAMPGIMTGTIIGMAHALGETAPLLMIGMIAFIVDVPGGLTEAATVLPVQIYLWSDLPEPAFQQKTAAAIIVLLMVLFVMNGLAIWLRKRFERRW
jgi:phosphate transport system permease protein